MEPGLVGLLPGYEHARSTEDASRALQQVAHERERVGREHAWPRRQHALEFFRIVPAPVLRLSAFRNNGRQDHPSHRHDPHKRLQIDQAVA